MKAQATAVSPTRTFRDQFYARIFVVGAVVIDRQWNARDVCSGYWRLYQNAGAGAALELPGGGMHTLTPGRLHLVPAWVRFTCRNTRPLQHRYVHFDLIGVTAATVRRVFTKPLMLARNPSLEALARALGTGASPDIAICRAKTVVYGALGMALDSLASGVMDTLAEPGPVAAAVRHIDDHLGEPISNRDLAARCHLSEDHFGRVFRDRMGQTPARYVTERRIAAAGQDLAFTSDSIEQIAARFGFANRYHLTRLFTRRMGMPPAAYRRQARV